MGGSGIEKLSFVLLLKADSLLKKMVPDEPVASECLPDDYLLLFRWLYPELHALGDGNFSISSLRLFCNCFGHGMSITYKYL